MGREGVYGGEKGYKEREERQRQTERVKRIENGGEMGSCKVYIKGSKNWYTRKVIAFRGTFICADMKRGVSGV